MDSLEVLGDSLTEHQRKILTTQSLQLLSHVKMHSKDQNLLKHPLIELDLLNAFERGKGDKITSDLSCIFSLIRQKQLILKMPFNAFISSVSINNKFNSTSLELAQGVIFIAAHHLSKLEGYEDVIKNGLRTIRLIIQKSDIDLFSKLPDFSRPLSEIVAELEKIKNNATNSNINRKLNSIHVLIKYYLEEEPKNKNTREHSSQAPGIYESSFLNVETVPLTGEGDHVFTQYKLVVTEKIKIFCQENERIADQTPSDRYVTVDLIAPESVKKSLQLQHHQAQNAANQLAKRKKELSCDLSQLTRYEIRQFLHEISESLKLNENIIDVYALLLLFTGKSMSSLLAIDHVSNSKKTLFWKKDLQGRVQIIQKMSLPKHQLKKRLKSLIKSSDSKIVLTLPEYISDFFLNNISDSADLTDAEQDVKLRINKINKKYNTRLTITRLSNYFGYFLKHSGVDTAEIALLTMCDEIRHSGNYYYQLPAKNLSSHYHQYTNSLLKLLKLAPEPIAYPENNNYIGTHLKVDRKHVRELFKAIKSRLASYRLDLSNIEQFHNLYVMHVLQLLFLATGHRPVRHPFQSNDIIDTDSKTIYISDKESRSQLSARVLVLPEIALKQIKLYQSHIQNLKQHYSFSEKKISNQITATQDNTKPLFFFITDNKIEYVTPKNLEHQLEQIFPLSLNWHRHLLRSHLGGLAIPGDWVDTWMGHSDFGDEGLGKFSGLSMKNLSNIAESIETFMKCELSVSALPGLE